MKRKGWNKLDYWLKGGIIGAAIGILFSILVLPFISSSASINVFLYCIPVIAIIKTITPVSLAIGIAIAMIVELFIIGAIIGWVTGIIIKNKNKVSEEETRSKKKKRR